MESGIAISLGACRSSPTVFGPMRINLMAERARESVIETVIKTARKEVD
jgi:hypothetical protein